MRIEIVNTGTELMLGQVINTHAAYFGEQLLPLGLRVQRQTCIPDGDPIAEVLHEAFARADVILITGGLGPTSDDITREILSAMLGMELRLNEAIVENIREKFRKFGREMPEVNRRQAMVPEGAVVLDNPNGTAPGLYFPAIEGRNPHLFLLPGPPRELRPMFEDLVRPRLEAWLADEHGSVPTYRTFRIMGVGESSIAEQLEDSIQALGELELGYCARLGEVDVRVIAGTDILDRVEALVRAHFPEQLVSTSAQSIQEVVVQLLKERSQWIATAESCTGGHIADLITNVPGASSVFWQGYVTYANDAKVELLGVPEALLAEHGAVSEPVAVAMAEGCLKRSNVHHALAVTGIAGPDGGTADKPLGTVFIAQASVGNETFVKRYRFPGERLSFKERVARMALDLTRKRILGFNLTL